jgi:hypothetical protein
MLHPCKIVVDDIASNYHHHPSENVDREAETAGEAAAADDEQAAGRGEASAEQRGQREDRERRGEQAEGGCPEVEASGAAVRESYRCMGVLLGVCSR